MAENAATLLGVLQHADTVFPTGSVSFSWGLEALYNRGIVANRREFEDFARAHIQGRWATLDRVMMVHAHRAGDDLQAVAWLDNLVEAQSLNSEQRLGSSRTGEAFLRTHRKLGSRLADDYSVLINRGEAYGHMPVVQGLIWRQVGFDETQIGAMAAHSLCTSLLGAAVRLSIIGHVDAQAIHARMLPMITHTLSLPVCGPEEAYSFTPQIDIASMNHETDEMRLFVN